MESPPSYSLRSEGPQLSEDSGLIITSGSFSSDSVSGWLHVSTESDYDDRSLSLYDSGADNFNTVKKGPAKVLIAPIEPPPQFQDSPVCSRKPLPNDVIVDSDDLCQQRKMTLDRLYVSSERRHYHRFTSPRLLHLSPCHTVARPASRSSLTSRLSSSHNSLVTQIQADDSSFITQAISHDTLSTSTEIADMYNVPFDSDIYAVPIDMIRPTPLRQKPKRPQRAHRKREKSTSRSNDEKSQDARVPRLCVHLADSYESSRTKRHSIAGPSSLRANSASVAADVDPMHMTLHEVRKYLKTLYSSSSESESKSTLHVIKNNSIKQNGFSNNKYKSVDKLESSYKASVENNNNVKQAKKNTLNSNVKSKKVDDMANSKELLTEGVVKKLKSQKPAKLKKSPAKRTTFNLKQTFCNLFRLKRGTSMETSDGEEGSAKAVVSLPSVLKRALPPLPAPSDATSHRRNSNDESVVDFATSIQRVKDCGWYWGPISVEAAEKILSNEPDGSFIVRDSSDDHYIFTLTFKLNGMRHVRIEHEQGNFCFGSCTMFKARTIIEFIENAVETSRSGRYLFFLNLRPLLGPVRVQLLYPVSRFKRVQSLQHMCRFVILKVVRKDLVNNLPLPRRLLDYLNASHYYAEQLADLI